MINFLYIFYIITILFSCNIKTQNFTNTDIKHKQYFYTPNIKKALELIKKNKLDKFDSSLTIYEKHFTIVNHYCLKNYSSKKSNFLSLDLINLIYDFYKGITLEETKLIFPKLENMPKSISSSMDKSKFFIKLMSYESLSLNILIDFLVRCHNSGIIIDKTFPFFQNPDLTAAILNQDNIVSKIKIDEILASYITNTIFFIPNIENNQLRYNVFKFLNCNNKITEITNDSTNIKFVISLFILFLNKKQNNCSKFFTYGKDLKDIISDYCKYTMSFCCDPIINLDECINVLNEKSIYRRKTEFNIYDKVLYNLKIEKQNFKIYLIMLIGFLVIITTLCILFLSGLADWDYDMLIPIIIFGLPPLIYFIFTQFKRNISKLYYFTKKLINYN